MAEQLNTAEHEAHKAEQTLDVEAARELLASDPKPATSSTDLWVQAGLFLSAAIVFVGARVFHITIAQTLASSGADLLLAAAASAYHAWARVKKPVQVPIAGTKAAETRLD